MAIFSGTKKNTKNDDEEEKTEEKGEEEEYEVISLYGRPQGARSCVMALRETGARTKRKRTMQLSHGDKSTRSIVEEFERYRERIPPPQVLPKDTKLPIIYSKLITPTPIISLFCLTKGERNLIIV